MEVKPMNIYFFCRTQMVFVHWEQKNNKVMAFIVQNRTSDRLLLFVLLLYRNRKDFV